MRETEMPLVDPNDAGIRPAGKPDECLYCKEKVGSPHLDTCVCVTKRIKARYTYEIELEIPYHWSAEDFEFHRNDSSWCSDNSIRELENFAKHLEESGMSCMCCIDGAFTAEFVEVVRSTPVREIQEDPKPEGEVKGETKPSP